MYIYIIIHVLYKYMYCTLKKTIITYLYFLLIIFIGGEVRIDAGIDSVHAAVMGKGAG